MMKKEELKQEHAQLKERLARLVDEISSEEYYSLPDEEKALMTQQRTGMEMYLNSLSLRLWGGTGDCSYPSSLAWLLMSSMLMPSMSSQKTFPVPSGSEQS